MTSFEQKVLTLLERIAKATERMAEETMDDDELREAIIEKHAPIHSTIEKSN